MGEGLAVAAGPGHPKTKLSEMVGGQTQGKGLHDAWEQADRKPEPTKNSKPEKNDITHGNSATAAERKTQWSDQ